MRTSCTLFANVCARAAALLHGVSHESRDEDSAGAHRGASKEQGKFLRTRNRGGARLSLATVERYNRHTLERLARRNEQFFLDSSCLATYDN